MCKCEASVLCYPFEKERKTNLVKEVDDAAIWFSTFRDQTPLNKVIDDSLQNKGNWFDITYKAMKTRFTWFQINPLQKQVQQNICLNIHLSQSLLLQNISPCSILNIFIQFSMKIFRETQIICGIYEKGRKGKDQ